MAVKERIIPLLLGFYAVLACISCPDNSGLGTPATGTPGAGQQARSRNFKSTPVSISATAQGTTGPRKSARYMAELADVHFKYGDFQKAAGLYAQAIDAEKDLAASAVYHYWLARSHRASGQKEQALAEYHKVIEINRKLADERPERRNFYIEKISRLYEELGDNAHALEWANKMDTAGGTGGAHILRTASLYIKEKQFEKAAEYCRKVIAGAREPALKCEAELLLAECHAKAGNHDKAIEILRRAATGAPSKKLKAAAKSALFALYRKLGRLDEIEFGKIKDKPEETTHESKKEPETGEGGKK